MKHLLAIACVLYSIPCLAASPRTVLRCAGEMTSPDTGRKIQGYVYVTTDGSRMEARVLPFGYPSDREIETSSVLARNLTRYQLLNDPGITELLDLAEIEYYKVYSATEYVIEPGADGHLADILVIRDKARRVVAKLGTLGWAPVVCK